MIHGLRSIDSTSSGSHHAIVNQKFPVDSVLQFQEAFQPVFFDNPMQQPPCLLLNHQIGIHEPHSEFLGKHHADGTLPRARHTDENQVIQHMQ